MEIKDFEIQTNDKESTEKRLKAYAEGLKNLAEKKATEERLKAYAGGLKNETEGKENN